MAREYATEDGQTIVNLYVWDHASCIRLSALGWKPSEWFEGEGLWRLQGVLFLDYFSACMEVEEICKNAEEGKCSPGILADWIEDHPEFWRLKHTEPVALICAWLRESTSSKVI